MTAAAILVAGSDLGSFDGHLFYANDLWLWRGLLAEQFGIPRERIFLLYTQGGTIPTSVPGGSFEAKQASHRGLTDTIRLAAKDLEEQDPFVLVASNHGSQDGLLLHGRTLISPEQLAAECQSLPSRRQIFVFGQCHAGIFLPIASEVRAVLAGCTAEQKTGVRKDDDRGRTLQWVEFLYDLAAALGGDPPTPATASSFADAFAQVAGGGMRRRPGKDGELPMMSDPGGVAASLRRLGA